MQSFEEMSKIDREDTYTSMAQLVGENIWPLQILNLFINNKMNLENN